MSDESLRITGENQDNWKRGLRRILLMPLKCAWSAAVQQKMINRDEPDSEIQPPHARSYDAKQGAHDAIDLLKVITISAPPFCSGS